MAINRICTTCHSCFSLATTTCPKCLTSAVFKVRVRTPGGYRTRQTSSLPEAHGAEPAFRGSKVNPTLTLGDVWQTFLL